jgi:hypothetical protein
VLAKAATLDDYRRAFQEGAFFAVRDQGIQKDRYPTIFKITVSETSITIESTGNVAWKTRGAVVGTNPVLLYSDLPADARYVRAEVSANDGSVLYTQAFSLRPRLDANGDYNVTMEDRVTCHEVWMGSETGRPSVAACEAARGAGFEGY